jgi:hypothetical protein
MASSTMTISSGSSCIAGGTLGFDCTSGRAAGLT